MHDRISNLAYSEMEELARNNGNLDALIALMKNEDLESASIHLGLEDKFILFEESKRDVSILDIIELNMRYRHYLIDKICFPEKVNE